MKKMKIILLAVLVASLTCCKTDMLDNVRQFTDKGEKIYAGKVDGLTALDGLNRIQLVALLPYGSTQTKCVVEITDPDGQKSVKEFDMADIKVDYTYTDLDGNEITMPGIQIELDDLEAGVYNFNVRTFDQSGNSSLVVSADGIVYAAMDPTTLKDRRISSLEFNVAGELVVKWGSHEYFGYTTLTYTNTLNQEIEIIVQSSNYTPLSPANNQTIIADSKRGTSISWKTTYYPSQNALDGFDSPGGTMPIPIREYKLDKSKFVEMRLAGDVLMGGWGMAASAAWNDNITDRCHNATDGLPLPNFVTIDLGVEVQLSRYIYWQFSGNYFGASNFEKWNVYGRADAPTDATMTGWTLLRNCENLKPAGLDAAQLTALGQAGHEYPFDDTLDKVRYIRFEITNIFGGNQLFIGELTFYGLIE